jgi:hypothetical protein
MATITRLKTSGLSFMLIWNLSLPMEGLGGLKLQQESQKEQILAIPSWHGFSATIQESGKLTGKEILLKIEFMGFGEKW